MSNDTLINKKIMYYGVDDSGGQSWSERTSSWEQIRVVLTSILIVITGIISFVAGLNSFDGVTFMYNWVFALTITYLVVSFFTFVSVVLAVMATRTAPWTKGKVVKEKAFQVKSHGDTLLAALLCLVVVTLIPLSVYGFKVGNVSNPCSDTTCDVRALVQGNSLFSLMWVASFFYGVILIKFVHLQSLTRVDLLEFTPAQADSIVATILLGVN